MNRKQRLALNTVSSLIFQITSIVCGFILPRLILAKFGSAVNGLVNSITQFLTIIAFLELGVGTVVQSSLYKPLADNDQKSISEIMASANAFFRKLAYFLIVYTVGLILAYPLIVRQEFDFVFTAALIGAMSISAFAQYYFGIADRLLLTADQRGFIQYNAQTLTLIVNTAACAVLIRAGAGIQLVKLTTSLIYLARPLVLRWYVNKHYRIDRKIKYSGEPIKQKWHGVAQHIAAVVLDNTDTVVLTVFSTLANVSIYGVHHLVVNGVKTLFTSMTKGIEALLGELWSKKEIEELRKTFAWAEWSIHTGVTFVFGCTASLIVAFVRIYTNGIDDANYIVPAFALLITLANALHCLRLPYNMMILAGGHYKQTQGNYITAAVLNLVISIATVKLWGLIGVAIGTVAAMLYQTIWMAAYDSRNFLNEPLGRFFRLLLADIGIFALAYCACRFVPLLQLSIPAFILLAAEVALIWGLIVAAVHYFFFPDYLKKLIRRMLQIGK